MSLKKVKLGEICTIEKGAIGIQKAIPGEYPLVVTGEDRKSHNEFQFDCEAVIIPLVSGTGHGHASIKRIHFQTGKFALGNILCAVIPKDPKQLSAEYLFRFLDLNKENELVARMKGMANVTLPIKEIAQIEIPLPNIEEQSEFVEMYKNLEKKSSLLTSEFIHQLDLVKKLRQQLLQDAVQGSLVEQNVKDGNAIILLNKIISERGNEAMQINDEKILFDIPENWVWCKLGDIAILKSGNQYSYSKDENGIMFVKVGDMNLKGNETEITTSSKYFERTFVNNRDLIPIGSIIFPKRGGAIATNKRRAVLKEPILVDSNTMAVIPSIEISFKYFLYWFSEIDLSKLGNDGVIPQVNNKDLNPILFPLPPLSEQHRIVQKLDELMQYCNDLEASIKQSQQQNEKLLQQVLREALRGE